MTTGAPNSVRRTILKRGAIGAASLAAAAVAAGAAGIDGSRAAPVGNTTARTMRFVGRGWHADTGSATLPGKGDRYAVYGELHEPGGDKVGEFFSQNVGVDSPFQMTNEGRGSFEIHTLALPEGTIVGVGIGGGGERTYAIVGGTGKYTGARGSYTARQSTYGLGGTGKAELLLTFVD